jgi:hypothetical protein
MGFFMDKNVINLDKKIDEFQVKPLQNWPTLIAAIKQFEELLSHISFNRSPLGRHESLRIYTTIASIIEKSIEIVARKPITADQYNEMLLLRPILHAVFESSGYRSISYMSELLKQRIRQEIISKDAIAAQNLSIVKILIDDLVSCGNEIVANINGLPVKLRAQTIVAYVSQRLVIDVIAEANRSKLYTYFLTLENYKFDDKLRNIVMSAWMYCTYSNDIKKHDFKEKLNQYISCSWSDNIKINSKKNLTKSNKTILVVNERYKSTHAMYRSYSKTFSNLQDAGLRIINLSRKEDIDDISRADFYKNYFLENYKSLDDAINTIFLNESPSLIWFPSVGMSFWSIVFANAKTPCPKVYSQGHPAPVRSKYMDYAIIDYKTLTTDEDYKEKKLYIDTPDFQTKGSDCYVLPSNIDTDYIKKLAGNQKVHDRTIIVNAQVMKLSPNYIDMLSKIEKANSDINIIFMPGERAFRYERLYSALSKKFAKFELNSILNYPDFIRVLSCARVSLVPDVFGSANSIFDCIMLGLPFVILKSERFEAKQSEKLLKMFDCPEVLLTNSVDEYIALSTRLLTDDTFWMQIHNDILNSSERINILSKHQKISESYDDINSIEKYIIQIIENEILI